MNKTKLKDIFSNIQIWWTPSRWKTEYFWWWFPWVSIWDMWETKIITTTKETLSEEGIKKSNAKLVKKGSFLFSFKLSVWKVAFAGTDLYTNEAIASFENWSTEIDLNYLYYCLPFYALKNPRKNNYGAPLLNKDILQNTEIPLPSLATQQSIADKLDKFQSLIDLKKQAIAKTDNLAKSIFLEIFGDPMTNEKGWEVIEFGRVCDRIVDWRNKTPEYIEKWFPVIRTTNVKKWYFDYKDLKYTNERDFKIWTSRVRPEIWDLVYTREAPLWVCALIKDDILSTSCLWQRVMIARINKEKINVEYANYILNDEFCFNQALNIAWWSTIKHIRVWDLWKLDIPLPPLSLQQKFADVITELESQKSEHKIALAKLEDLYQSEMQRSF